jgi:hypothetical protein
MNTNERIAAALETAKQGDFHTARNILLLVEDRADKMQMQRAWSKFGKYWRGE